MKVVAYLSIGPAAKCNRQSVLELEDDMTHEEIDEAVQEWLLDTVKWGWTPMECKTPQEMK